MSTKRSHAGRAVAAGIAALALSADPITTTAQTYPTRPVRLVNEGAEPAIKTPDELGKYVAAEMAKWVQVAKIAGIRGE